MANTPTSSTSSIVFLVLLLAPFSSASEYADHCNSVVPESPPTIPFIGLYPPYISNGFFSGGGNLILSKLNLSLSTSPSFDFRSTSLRKTRSPGILKVDATLVLRRPYVSVKFRNSTLRSMGQYVKFDLAGFWSESTGELCMIGYSTIFRPGGGPLLLSAVFRLNYPKTSNISTSLLRGTVNSSSEIDSPNHFDPISLLAYAENKYDFTMISQANSSCSSPNHFGEENIGFDPSLACSYIRNVVAQTFHSDGCSGRSCRTLARSFGFSPRFMSLGKIDCTEESKIRLLIQFSNSSENGYDRPFVPEKSLVAEGYWDQKKNQACLIACPVLQDDSKARFTVGDCSVGLSLLFPAVLTLRNRSEVVGRMWSNKDKDDAGYFDTVSFQALSTPFSRHMLSIARRKYKYTEMDSVKQSCAAVIRGSASSSTYPDVRTSADMQFHARFHAAGGSGWGSVELFSAGDVFYGGGVETMVTTIREFNEIVAPAVSQVALVSPPPAANKVDLRINVSYAINYKWRSAASPYKRERIYIAAEGIYNAGTGTLCMKGCRYPSSDRDSTDCETLIKIQLPALNAKGEERVNGNITSTRSKTDPLYFEPISLYSRHMYVEEAAESIWRMDVEIAMVLASLTLSCICIALQILYSKKHRAALPSMSIVMLAVLVAGYLIPLVLNFDAVFVSQRRHSVQLQRGGWVEVNEVVVRVMSVAALFLTSRLVQAAWAAKSTEESGRQWAAEMTTLKLWLPLCFAGALLTWFVGAWSYKSQPQGPELGRRSRWEELIPYAGFVLDGFLLPQILLNLCRGSTERVLTPFFYGGITATRVLPHLYDAYRTHRFLRRDDSSNFYAARDGDFYSSAWDVIVPCEGLLLAVLMFLQQRFGGAFFVPRRMMKFPAYEEASAEEPEQNCPP